MTEQIDYDPNTVLEALNNKADRDLNNVTDGTYQVLTTKNITNCITKIPQDIELELNDGNLTLKAGSKVYVPNGSDVFDEVTIQSDYSQTANTSWTSGLLLFNKTLNLIDVYPYHFVFSGAEQPSEKTYMWYNTDTGYIKRYVNYVDSGDTISFPIGEFTGDGSKITSISVFNGFGYIGSTIFALPGVEGLIPNGRNTDGSLNNTKFTTTDILTVTQTGTATFSAPAVIDGQNHINMPDYAVREIFKQATQPTKAGSWYDTINNFWYYSTDGINWIKKEIYLFISNMIIFTNGKITSFNPKDIFQAVDRNDKEEIISWGMPDYSAGIDVTAYSSSSKKFTAPCDGVLIFTLSLISNGVRIYIDDVLLAMPSAAGSATVGTTYSFVISKGQKFYVSPGSFYTLYGINAFFPFKGVN